MISYCASIAAAIIATVEAIKVNTILEQYSKKLLTSRYNTADTNNNTLILRSTQGIAILLYILFPQCILQCYFRTPTIHNDNTQCQ